MLFFLLLLLWVKEGKWKMSPSLAETENHSFGHSLDTQT